MARRARPHKEPKVDPLVHNRATLQEAVYEMHQGPLGSLLQIVQLVEANFKPGNPEEAAVSHRAGVIYLNLKRNDLVGKSRWCRMIAHMLLHLGLNHAAQLEDRDPWLWNRACEEAVETLLPLFGFGG